MYSEGLLPYINGSFLTVCNAHDSCGVTPARPNAPYEDLRSVCKYLILQVFGVEPVWQSCHFVVTQHKFSCTLVSVFSPIPFPSDVIAEFGYPRVIPYRLVIKQLFLLIDHVKSTLA